MNIIMEETAGSTPDYLLSTDKTGLVVITGWMTNEYDSGNSNDLQNYHDINYGVPLTQTEIGLLLDRSMSETMYSFDSCNSKIKPSNLGCLSLDYDQSQTDHATALKQGNGLPSDRKESAKERRRLQNRFAQRAYRHRREQAIKEQEQQIATLKMELEKERKINQVLARSIQVLKQQIPTKSSVPRLCDQHSPQNQIFV